MYTHSDTNTLYIFLTIQFSIIGALAASILGFVLPGIIYLKSREVELRNLYRSFVRDDPLFELSFIRKFELFVPYFVPFFLVLFGFLVLILGVSTVILDST